MLVAPDQDPRITDTVLFTLNTTDSSGAPVNPYVVNNVTIYFLQREFWVANDMEITVDFDANPETSYFSGAQPVLVLGTPDTPAWLSTDIADAFIEQIDFDANGNPQIGVFQFEWTPNQALAREGDYVICWQWTPIAAGDILANSLAFILRGNTSETTSIPTHRTVPDKYIKLLTLYTPDMFRMSLGLGDLSPNVIDRTNKAVAKGFTSLEDLANQMLDMIDANAVADAILPYLSNLFAWTLKSQDSQLWRRQIKQAVPLYKRKGTLGGLRAAFAECGMHLSNFTQLWQIVSPWTWQEAFVVTQADVNSYPITFSLAKCPVLPANTDNYQVFLRPEGTDEYVQLGLDYVVFSGCTTPGACQVNPATVTWNGNNLSVNPISLQVGDVVRVIYEIAVPPDQSLSDYILTLPVADTRDELTVTYPLKNWNVRLISPYDPMFDVLCPVRNPYQNPVVFGQVRTEFPFSENIFNMDEYNGSIRNSTDPCDIDKNFLDSCSCCLSSYFDITVEVENLDPTRISEISDVITDFVPFHALPYSINYVGGFNEYILSPIEVLEALILFKYTDDIIVTQFDFNRLIPNGLDSSAELNRSMLASSNIIETTTGTGQNSAITLYSPGSQWDGAGIDEQANVLEILAGTSQGQYQCSIQNHEKLAIDIVPGSPNTIPEPLDPTAFPFRISNVVYTDPTATIYQNDIFTFSDSSQNFAIFAIQPGWSIIVTGGLFPGTYPVVNYNTNDTLNISGWSTPTNALGLSYQLVNSFNQTIIASNQGAVTVTRQGLVEIPLVAEELGIVQNYYLLFLGVQYLISSVAPRALGATFDKVYIEGYTSGNVVGVANVTFYNRIIDKAVGYVQYRGMQLTGIVPTLDYTLEDNMFLENYLILINTNYYQITNITNNTMTLAGPMLTWALGGTSVNYSIVQFIKTSPITASDGVEFFLLDRRGNDSLELTTETQMSMSFAMSALNGNNLKDAVVNNEEITLNIEYR